MGMGNRYTYKALDTVENAVARNDKMKAKIHPKYVDCTVTCGCGNTFKTRSTQPELKVEICSSCHPFFTGQEKFVDSAGRVERFNRKFGGDYFKGKQTRGGKAAKA